MPDLYFTKQRTGLAENGLDEISITRKQNEPEVECAIILFTKTKVMKTRKLSLTLLALVFAATAFAAELPKMNVVTFNNAKVYLTALTSPQFSSEVSLYDFRGNKVYSKKSEAAPQFRLLMNLHLLEDGVYNLCLKNGKFFEKRQLTIDKGVVCVQRAVKETAPVFWHAEGKVYVTYLNRNKADVALLVYKNNKLVHESKMGCDFALQRCFDVSHFSKGNFEFVLRGNNCCYNYRMSL